VTLPDADLRDIADRLIAAYDGATTLPPITIGAPYFSVADGYAVLHDIETRRRAQGWQSVGRKIGFTNRTIWPRYGVPDGEASLPLTSFVQPRIEPEVVFKLKGPVLLTDDPLAILAATEWIAPGFEIVQSHFPD
jgi:2-oxo-3-hexenedioate decarboxylase